MQRTPKANEKWKPMPISNSASRIRAACKMPPWMGKGNSNESVAPPVPSEPPPFDPDYEVIEFPPAQQYTNAPLRSNDKHRSGSGQATNHRCDLCGSSAPCVRCDRCNNQTFCNSCDDMYHRHPKRQNHVRKALGSKSQVLPPLPPKGEMFVPPIPPPRRHKKTSRMTTPTPEEQNRHFKKEGSLIGSLKRFIGGRPLPPTPQMPRDPRFLHSSTAPLSPVEFNDQPSSRDSGYLDWESDLKHRSGSMTALNNSFFPPLMQAQSMAQLNCPSCHQHGMMWDWGSRMNHFHSPSVGPWAGGTPTGTWHGSQMLPSAYKRQNNSPFDETFWRRPGIPHPPSRSSTRSRRDLSQDSYEDEPPLKTNHKQSFRNASPALSKRNYASSDTEDETASKRGGSQHRTKALSRQRSREVSPALSRHSVRRCSKMQDELPNRGSRRFKKSASSRNVSPTRSRKNSRRELSDSDENNNPESPDIKTNGNSSPVLSTISHRPKSNVAPKQKQYNLKSSCESVKDSSSSDHCNQEKDIPFVPTVDWECQHCTFVNKAGSRVCAVCCKTTSVLHLKNRAKPCEELSEEEKLSQSTKALNISNSPPEPNLAVNKADNELNNSSPKLNTVKNNAKHHRKVLTSTRSIDVNLEKAVISTGTSPPPQSISTQTYDVGGGKLRRATSLADHDSWKPPTRSLSRQSMLSDSLQSLPDVDETLMNFEAQQPSKPQLPFGRRSFDAVNQNLIRPSARRGGSQPPDYSSTMVQKQMKQGLEMVKLLRDAEQHHFSADDISVALTHCGENDPVAWLLDNWQNMIDTVVTLATNYGHERKENTIGTISVAEARKSLRMHKGNVWAAVTECVEQRQSKYAELLSRGNFSREDIVTVLTANHGDLDAAYAELSKSQLKPFLMRIWGPPQGVENDSGDTSKLFKSDSFEKINPAIENDKVKDTEEVSATDNFSNHLNETLSHESDKNDQVIDLDELSNEQLKILECTEALKNIYSSVYDDDIISASLKLGLQNIIQQNRDHIHANEDRNAESSNKNAENDVFDLPSKLQILTDCGLFKLPLSSLKGADTCVIFNSPLSSEKKNIPTENRQSYAQKGFSHALKSNFQPYRTVSVCDLSDSNFESPRDLNHAHTNNNQINLSTIYYDDASKRLQNDMENSSNESANDRSNKASSDKPNDNTNVIPQLYMEVSHETGVYTKEDFGNENVKEKGSLENETTKKESLMSEKPPKINHENETVDSTEHSDSEVFYETFSVICDRSDSVNVANQEKKSLVIDKNNIYNVEFQKDLVFVASDVTAPEQNPTLKKINWVPYENNSETFNDKVSEVMKNLRVKDKSESDSEASFSEKKEKSRSVSEDSSKDYQSVEENTPEILTEPKENPLNKSIPSSNIPRPNFSTKSTEKKLTTIKSSHDSNQRNSEQSITDSEVKPKQSNFLIKSKKKPKRFTPKKPDRRLSFNGVSNKSTKNVPNQNSKPTIAVTTKLPSSIPLSNTFKAKSAQAISSQPKTVPRFSDKVVLKDTPRPSLRKCIDSKPELNKSKGNLTPRINTKALEVLSGPENKLPNCQIETSPDDCSTESEVRANQTIVHTEILRGEPADIDCDDGNPNVLEVSRQENVFIDGTSDLNSVGLTSQNNEPNSSDSTMKNILSISDDTSSFTNADNSKIDEVLNVPTQRSSSADTHAGVESTNLDEGNQELSQNLSMVENREEIIQLLRDSLSNDQVLEGIIHRLVSSITGGNQDESKIVKVMNNGVGKMSYGHVEKAGDLGSDAVTSAPKYTNESHGENSNKDLNVNQDPRMPENENDCNSQNSEELDFHRKARRYLAEGVVSDFEQAKLVVHLLELNFDKELSISAAKECSNLETALSFLQQECLLCAGKYPVRQMISMLSCEHLCCQECASHYFTLQITERSINDCVCPFCKEPSLTAQYTDYVMNYFSNLDILLKSFLEPQVHELFQRKLRDRTLMQDPNFKWCAQCSFGFIADLRQKRLTCPDCQAVTCAACHRPWTKEHERKTCDEYDEWLESNDPGSLLARHLVEHGVTCPACHSKYALVKGGCMHLTCPQCKHEFCSDCSKTFLMGSKCNVSPFCEKLGLHAHHPRNCLFYLRDKEPDTLEKLLISNNVEFDKNEKENKRCNVQLQRETSDGLIDGVCNYQVFQAGLCRRHYIEYLSLLIRRNNLETIDVLTSDDFETILKRAGIKLPANPYGYPPESHYNDLYKIVEEQIPLE